MRSGGLVGEPAAEPALVFRLTLGAVLMRRPQKSLRFREDPADAGLFLSMLADDGFVFHIDASAFFDSDRVSPTITEVMYSASSPTPSRSPDFGLCSHSSPTK